MRHFFTEPEAGAAAETAWPLRRRGVDLGWVTPDQGRRNTPSAETIRTAWEQSEPVYLPGMLLEHLPDHLESIRDALTIMRRVREGESCADILDGEPYQGRLQPDFDLLAPVYNDSDEQEIEKVVFDAVKSGELHAEDLWMKCSCLSFHEADESIRFRFSYGMEMYKSHVGDALREHLASELANRVFPECRILAEHPELNALLTEALGQRPDYVEKIIYSNAPEGGAHFHQDVETAHTGVIYGQLYGHTGWLALPRQTLIETMRDFILDPANDSALRCDFPDEADHEALKILANDQHKMAEQLEADDQGILERLLNGLPAFIHSLIAAGHGRVLSPGDVLLLPQTSTEQCCWHSVFCLGDEPGHALSFAMRNAAG
ncbi:MAG TPA: hypothetical protein VJ961_02555 [Mariprofundaceae bacterium]|nr:hypothetical protein [Mariprofundaceae bacterium]